MKRKLFALLMSMLIALLCLASCKIGGSGGDETPASSSSVFGSGLTTYIIREAEHTDSSYISLLNTIKAAIESKTGKSTLITDDGYQQTEHEIVLGNTNRPISVEAKAALDKALLKAVRSADNEEEAAEDMVGYTVYASGGSVAIVWSEEKFMNAAVQYFIDNYLSDNTLELKDGYAHSETFSYLAYLKEQDAIAAEAEWAAVEEALGEEAARALKNHYAMFDERFYLWIADLYDPTVGGFYFSNSARDTMGFLPDIESTVQSLSFLNNSGMTKTYTASHWKNALSDEMRDQLVAFAKSLQSSEDGYFYHPQWPQDEYTYPASRLARDAGWATQILSAYYEKYDDPYLDQLKAEGIIEDRADVLLQRVIAGEYPELAQYLPLYNTPNGYTGLLGEPGTGAIAPASAGLTGRLGSKSTVTLVSKVVSTASVNTASAKKWTTQLQTIENWTAYIYGGTATDLKTGKTVVFDGYDLKTKSYNTGNNFASQGAQIKQRDAEAKKNGEPTGYEQILKEFFYAAESPETGVWEDVVKYNSINGLMKTSGLYNTMGWEIQYPDKAMESAIYIAMLDVPDVDGKEPTGSVDVYNPWVAMSQTFTNVKSYNKSMTAAEKEAFNAKYRAMITDNAAAMIKATSKKVAKFAKLDGSYGYNWGNVGTTSQGMPVAVEGTYEGDINGGCIACTGTINHMTSGLGITKPALFRSADMEIFLRRINSLSGVIKDSDVAVEVVPYDFEDEAVGTDPSGGDITSSFKDGELVVVERGDSTEENFKAVRFSDFATGDNAGATVTFKAHGLAQEKASTYVLEFDIYLENINANSYIQLKMGSGSTASYMLTLDGNADGTMSLGDGSSTGSNNVANSFGFKILNDGWHKIRAEYYKGTEDTVRTKIYMDGLLRYVSSNFYGKHPTEAREPYNKYPSASFYSTYGSTLTIQLDNVIVERNNQKWVDEAIQDPDRIKNFEKSKIGGNMPNGLTAQNSAIAADPLDSANKVLKLPDASGDVVMSVTTKAAPANVFAFESRIYVPETANGEIAKLYMDKGSVSSAIYALSMEAVTEGSQQYITFKPVSSDGVMSEAYGRAPIGDWFKLRIEYYRYQYNADYTEIQSIIYIDDEIVGRLATYYSFYNISFSYSNFRIVKSSLAAAVYTDDMIAENDVIAYVNADGVEIPDPNSPSFPLGGDGSSTPAGEGYDGRLDFEGYENGVPAVPGLTTTPNSAEYGNDIEIADDPTGKSNKALLLSTRAKVNVNAGNTAAVVPYIESSDANCSVLEWDMYITKGGKPDYQIRVGAAFMLTINSSGRIGILTNTNGDAEGGRISESTGVSIPFGEWHNIRVEYYHGSVETVKIKIYVDGKLKNENNHFYGKGTNEGMIGTPSDLYDEENLARFYSGYSSAADVYLDNIIAEKIVKEYKTEELWYFNGHYDFEEGTEMPSFSYTGSSAITDASVTDDPTVSDGTNKVMHHVTEAGAGGSTLYYSPSAKVPEGANCYVYQYDIYAGATNKGSFQISLGNSKWAYDIMTTFAVSSGATTVTMKENTGDKLTLLSTTTISDWVTVRIEYYPEKGAYQLYFGAQGGELTCIAESKACDKSQAITQARMFANNSGTNLDLYIDNVILEQIVKNYVPFGYIDFGEVVDPSTATGDYSFDGCEDGELGLNGIHASANNSSFNVTADPNPEADGDKALYQTSSSENGGKLYVWQNPTVPENANCYVFEYDFKLDYDAGRPSNNTYFDILLGNSSYDEYALKIRLDYYSGTSSTSVRFFDNFRSKTALAYTTSAGVSNNVSHGNNGSWCHVRIEYYPDEGCYKLIYTHNGVVYTHAENTNVNTAVEITNAEIITGNATVLNIYLDNFRLAKTYVELPLKEAVGSRGEGKYANDETYKDMAEGYEEFNSATANENITVTNWADKKTAATTAWSTILEDLAGKYLNVGKNGAETEKSVSFKPNTAEDITGKAYKYVFETDFMWGGCNDVLIGKEIGYLRLHSPDYTTNSNGYFNYYAFVVDSDGNLTLGGSGAGTAVHNAMPNVTLNVGEWYNIRLELLVGDGSYRVRMFLNGDFVGSTGDRTEAGYATLDYFAIELRSSKYIFSSDESKQALARDLDYSLDNTFAARIAQTEEDINFDETPKEPENFRGDWIFDGLDNDSSVVTGDIPGIDFSTNDTSGGNTLGIYDDPSPDGEGDKALLQHRPKDVTVGSTVSFYSSETVPEGANCYVFETDFMLWFDQDNMPTNNSSTEINFLSGSSQIIQLRFNIYSSATVSIQFKEDAGNKTILYPSNVYEAGWIHISVYYWPEYNVYTFVLTDEEGTAHEFTGAVHVAGNKNTVIDKVQFYSNNSPSGSDVYFDNVILGKVAREYDTTLGNYEFDYSETGTSDVSGVTVTTNSTSSVTVVEDPLAQASGDKAFLIDSAADSNGNTVKFASDVSVPAGANCYVFEADIYMPAATATTTGLQMSMYGSGTTPFMSMNVSLNKTTGMLTFKARVDSNSGNDITLGAADVSSWGRIRVEYYPASDTVKLYANGDYVGEAVANYNAAVDTTYGSVGVYTMNAGTYKLYLDNVVVKQVSKTYGQGMYASSAETYTDGYPEGGTTTGTTTQTFGSGLKTDLYAYGKPADKDGASWSTVVSDGDNSYLSVGRINSTSALASNFYFDDAGLTENYKYVFETDIRWGGSGLTPVANSPFFFNIYVGETRLSGSSRPYISQDANGNLYFQGSQNGLMAPGVWYNLRVEFIKTSDTAMDWFVYVNDTQVKSVTGVAIESFDITKIGFQVRNLDACPENDEYFEVSYDNTFCSRVALEAAAE